MHLHGVSK